MTDYSTFLTEKYSIYQKLTKKRNWERICTLNKASLDSSSISNELQSLPKHLEDNEVVFVIISGSTYNPIHPNSSTVSGTWLIALTSKRILCLYHSCFWSEYAEESIDLQQVLGVSQIPGWFFSTILIDLGTRSVTIENCEKLTATTFVNLSNTLIASQKNQPYSMVDYEKFGMTNYSKYAEFTRHGKWEEICKLNGVPFYHFGTSEELKVLQKYLEGNEVVFALTSGIIKQSITSNRTDDLLNTWLVVLTSTRFLFLDHALLSSSVDAQSVRLEHVQAVSSSQGWVYGKIIIDLGARLIDIDNCLKSTLPTFVKLSNTWLSVLDKIKNAPQEKTVPQQVAPASPLDELKKLADLKAAGVITDEEFMEAKAKLLKQL